MWWGEVLQTDENRYFMIIPTYLFSHELHYDASYLSLFLGSLINFPNMH